MKGSRPYLSRRFAVFGKHLREPVLDLVCRFVGKGDRQNPIGLTGLCGKFGEQRQNVRRRQDLRRPFHARNLFFGQILRDAILKIRVAVFDQKGNAAHENGGFSAPRSCQYQQRTVHGKDRFPLPFVQIAERLIKQSAFGFLISFFQAHFCFDRSPM